MCVYMYISFLLWGLGGKYKREVREDYIIHVLHTYDSFILVNNLCEILSD
jgi:hypothetical protein